MWIYMVVIRSAWLRRIVNLQKHLLLEQIDNHTQNDTDDQHGGDGYEYFAVSGFNMDISWQFSKPAE